MNSRLLPQFDLLRPQSVAESIEMLALHQSRVSILAGGTDLLVGNHRAKKKMAPYLLSLAALKELDYLNYLPGEGLRIGAKARVARLLDNPAVADKFQALHQAAATFATPQIRNMATVMGNVLRASPAGDCSCAILALGGEVVLQSSAGQRVVDIDDLWISYGVTARREDELAVELRIPDPSPGSRTVFQRLTRVHEDLSKLNVAVHLEMKQDVCVKARIAMGCVGPTPLRLRRTEKTLEGKPITDALLQLAAATAEDEIAPIDDQRSTAEYRRQVSGVLVRRVIARAAANA